MSAPGEPTTIRGLMEQQIAEIDYLTSRDTADNLTAFRILRKHAVAALAILGAANYARREGFPSTRYAYIRDPLHPHDAPEATCGRTDAHAPHGHSDSRGDNYWCAGIPDPVRVVGCVEPHDDNGDTT